MGRAGDDTRRCSCSKTTWKHSERAGRLLPLDGAKVETASEPRHIGAMAELPLHTGPYYLAMIVPVAIFELGIVQLSVYGWLALGTLILGGSYIIWWATERVWGKFAGLH